MTHVDLFSGIGGFALAASWAGFQTVQFCELDPWCHRVLNKNFPGVPIHDDIRTFRATDFRGVDLVTGGFPCQDISCAGNGAGIIDGARSALWFEMLRVVRECRPLFLLAENVPALRTKGIDRVLYGLEEAGYAAEPFVVGAGSAGAPHIRKRVFIVGLDANRITSRPNPGRWLSHDKERQHTARQLERDNEFIRVDLSAQVRGVASDSNGERQLQRQGLEPKEWGRTIHGSAPYIPWRGCEPPVPGVVARVPRSVDRVRGLGNSVVPVHAYAFLKVIADQLEAA